MTTTNAAEAVVHLPTMFSAPPEHQRTTTPDECAALLQAMIMDRDDTAELTGPELLAWGRENGIGFPHAVMLAKLAGVPDMKFRKSMALALLYLVDRAGMGTLYAYALVRWQRENGRTLTMDEWCESVCPLGVPTTAYANTLWDAQKQYRGAFDNWLDTPEAWA